MNRVGVLYNKNTIVHLTMLTALLNSNLKEINDENKSAASTLYLGLNC